MVRPPCVRVAAIAGLALSTVVPAGGGGQRSGGGGLPAPIVDALPPRIRADITRAYEGALAAPDDAAPAGRLAMLLHAYEQFESADAWYGRARSVDPGAFSWTYLSGVARMERGDDAGAVAALRRALELDAASLPARVRLGDALLASGDPDGSLAVYDGLLGDDDDLALAHYGKARALAALDRSAEAAAHYERALAHAPRFGAAHYALALLHRRMGFPDRAQPHLDAYRRDARHRPAVADPLLEEVRAMRQSARDLIAEAARQGRAGRLAESIALHLRALDADAGAAQAHVNLISLYGRTGDAAAAERHYRAALALRAHLDEAHYNFGVMLAARGDSAAAGAFRSALEANPFHAPAHNNLAVLHAKAGETDRAAAHYRQALAADPRYRTARYNLGQLLLATGRVPEAIGHFRRLLEHEDEDTPRHTFALSNAYAASGDRAQADAYARQARQQAERLGQTELARTIDEALRRRNGVPR